MSEDQTLPAPPVPPEVSAAPTASETPSAAKPRGRPKGATAKRTVKMARVTVTRGFKLYISSQDILVLPGATPKVELDNFVKHQIDAGNLAISL